MTNTANDQVIEAWNTVLFQKFNRYQYVLTEGLKQHGERALQHHPVREGARVLDIGSGFGDATRAIARAVGPRGEAVGVDCAASFVDVSRRDAARAGLRNARFIARDVQTEALDGPYDYAFSRFGTMFFASPVAALHNVRKALRPGSPLTMVVWRKREDNAWLFAAEQRVRELVAMPRATNEPTCGPGPFSMASADMVSDQLRAAGFEALSFERFDSDICIGRDLDEAVGFALELGPAGEIMRLAGEVAEQLRPQVTLALREVLTPFVRDDGVFASSSTWIVNARTNRGAGSQPAVLAA